MNILIVAGGTGSRLWPASRQSKPKQLLKLVDDHTLLQNTYQRSAAWVDKPEHIYIATTAAYESAVKAQLPKLKNHMSIEPCLRGRAPAIGLAALIMHHYDPKSSFITMWGDHSINEPKNYFKNLLKKLEKFLNKNPEATITVGVTPTWANTGYGYIQKGATKKNEFGIAMNTVASFKEKPDAKTAEKFLKSGKYLWNSGYFVWKTETLLKLYKEHIPEVYELLMQIKPTIGTKKERATIAKLYPQMPKTDIEAALLEKIKDNIYTVQGEFEWADIGSWKTVKDVQSGIEDNLSRGRHVSHESSGNLVFNYAKDMLVATVGTKELIVVVTKDAVLVADKHHSEDLRKIIAQLEEDKKLNKYL